MSGSPAVFVDRDGTLIREVGYLNCLQQIEVLLRVPEAIQLLHQHELKVVVITNQSGVARGFLSEDKLEQIHQELKSQLLRCGAFLDGIYYCPHHPTEGMDPYRVSCECRKPNVGLAKRAAAELNLDLGRSYVVGDQSIDMELGARIGAKGILIRNEKAEGRPQEAETKFLVVKDLWEAAQWIIRDLQRRG
jgi:D-glycero-D-manno-heptose 1,7-bisphosphate phosphatase